MLWPIENDTQKRTLCLTENETQVNLSQIILSYHDHTFSCSASAFSSYMTFVGQDKIIKSIVMHEALPIKALLIHCVFFLVIYCVSAIYD